jgi:ubiquinone/menaquinone biosynthesis C-methylase UbiE
MNPLRGLLHRDKRVCPWWLAYTFDNPLRRYLHDPRKIFVSYLRVGMSAIDIGCGMGVFSIGMAEIVGDTGRVISVDLQQEMLEITRKRAEKRGVANRIRLHRSEQGDIGITERVDFALAFWMVHEVEDTQAFFKQVHSILKQTGLVLIAEPKIHVSRARFEEILFFARKAGFKIKATAPIRFSRAVVLTK